MPDDLMIPAVQAITSAPGPRAERNARAPVVEARATPTPYVNPTLRLDADVGLVVMEFRDDAGTVTTIPNERQLAAYRAHQEAAARIAAEPAETAAADAQGLAEPALTMAPSESRAGANAADAAFGPTPGPAPGASRTAVLVTAAPPGSPRAGSVSPRPVPAPAQALAEPTTAEPAAAAPADDAPMPAVGPRDA